MRGRNRVQTGKRRNIKKLTKLEKVLDNGQRLSKLKTQKFAGAINRAEKLKWNGPVKINFVDPLGVEGGKAFCALQREKILAENRLRNGGVLRSDCSGKIIIEPTKFLAGVEANLYWAEVEHILPKSLGGSNSYSNAQVLSKAENLLKGNQNQVCPLLGH